MCGVAMNRPADVDWFPPDSRADFTTTVTDDKGNVADRLLEAQFVLMEYLPGNLLQYLRAVKTETIGFDSFYLLAMHVLYGLHFLQQHDVIHFDVKPENILVEMRSHRSTSGTDAPIRAVICDFGCARLCPRDGHMHVWCVPVPMFVACTSSTSTCFGHNP